MKWAYIDISRCFTLIFHISHGRCFKYSTFYWYFAYWHGTVNQFFTSIIVIRCIVMTSSVHHIHITWHYEHSMHWVWNASPQLLLLLFKNKYCKLKFPFKWKILKIAFQFYINSMFQSMRRIHLSYRPYNGFQNFTKILKKLLCRI